jgi:hypothetical protein
MTPVARLRDAALTVMATRATFGASMSKTAVALPVDSTTT